MLPTKSACSVTCISWFVSCCSQCGHRLQYLSESGLFSALAFFQLYLKPDVHIFFSSNLPGVLCSPFLLLIAERRSSWIWHIFLGTRALLTLERTCGWQKMSGKKKNADVRAQSDWRKDMKKWRGWQRTDWDGDFTEPTFHWPCSERRSIRLAVLSLVLSVCPNQFHSLFLADPSHSPGHFLSSSLYEQPLPSVLWHCWLGHLTRKNPSPIWPIMCLVGR